MILAFLSASISGAEGCFVSGHALVAATHADSDLQDGESQNPGWGPVPDIVLLQVFKQGTS